MPNALPLGERLVAAEHIDAFQLRAALAYQSKWGCRLGKALVELKMVTERTLTTELARIHDVPIVSLRGFWVSPAVLRVIPAALARKRRVLPLAKEGAALYYAAEQPQDLAVHDEVRFAFCGPVRPCLAADTELDEAIDRHYPEAAEAGTLHTRPLAREALQPPPLPLRSRAMAEPPYAPGGACRCGQHTLQAGERIRGAGAMIHTRVCCGPERRVTTDRRQP